MKNILITGGMGFLGQHLINTLLRQNPDYDITVLDRANPGFFISGLSGKKNIRIISNIDISNINSLDPHFKGIDAVFHLAAFVSFWRKDKKVLMHTNVGGTKNVLQLCKKYNVKRMIYVSSTAALGFNNDKDNPAAETLKYDWGKAKGLNYMLSKYHAEQQVRQACGDGLPVIIANPSTMFGPGDRKIFPLIDNLLAGKLPAMLPGGYSILDVRDSANALSLMLEKGKIGGNYLLAGGNYTYKEMLTAFAEILNVPPPSKTLPVWLGPILVPAITMLEILSPKQPKLTKEILAPGFKYRYFISAKAEKELGWKPERPLKETLKDAYDYYKTQKEAVK